MSTSRVPETGARPDMERWQQLLDMAAMPTSPLAGTWMLMAASTRSAFMAMYATDQTGEPPYGVVTTLASVPVLLDDEMPPGTWRLIDRNGKTVARGLAPAVVSTPPESAPASSAQGDEGGAESPTSAPPATPH